VSFIDFLEKIQKKPRHIRFQILWLTVFICMVLIGSLWILSLKYSMIASVGETSQALKESEQKIEEGVPSLGEVFRASLNAFFEKSSLLEEEINKEKELLGENESDFFQTTETTFEKRTIKPARLPLEE
jgi:hypothetical protein